MAQLPLVRLQQKLLLGDIQVMPLCQYRDDVLELLLVRRTEEDRHPKSIDQGQLFLYRIRSVQILPAATLIGCTTFLLSLVGVCAGRRFGNAYKNKATLAGGIILCLIGLKILLEHLGLLS